ncbi:hypothetical protein V502_05958 [Pseudogymnoascus sp. VKM F-4520 (FW-2644)]|nr:hypothetical protein V502_05958 [Pseudogymnoascus sp. VKM F-4520 (FW-2644)]
MNISEKQLDGPLLPTTIPVPITTHGTLATYKSRKTALVRAVYKRLKTALAAVHSSFVGSTGSLNETIEFVSAVLRLAAILVQVLCIAGVAVWTARLFIEVVAAMFFTVTPHTIDAGPVFWLVGTAGVVQALQVSYSGLDAMTKYTKVMERVLTYDGTKVMDGEFEI